MSTMTTRPPGRTTTTLPGETRILVPGASWRLYQTFVEMLPEGSRIRTAFDGRDMEIMVKGPVHDHFADLLDQFVKAVAGELGIRHQAHERDDLDASRDRAGHRGRQLLLSGPGEDRDGAWLR